MSLWQGGGPMFVAAGSVERAWRPGSSCMAGVRGGALAMRNFSGFGLHGARKSVPNSPAWRLRLRKMRQLNQLPPPPTRPLGSYLR